MHENLIFIMGWSNASMKIKLYYNKKFYGRSYLDEDMVVLFIFSLPVVGATEMSSVVPP